MAEVRALKLPAGAMRNISSVRTMADLTGALAK